jgi:hypothetical protein
MAYIIYYYLDPQMYCLDKFKCIIYWLANQSNSFAAKNKLEGIHLYYRLQMFLLGILKHISKLKNQQNILFDNP